MECMEQADTRQCKHVSRGRARRPCHHAGLERYPLMALEYNLLWLLSQLRRTPAAAACTSPRTRRPAPATGAWRPRPRAALRAAAAAGHLPQLRRRQPVFCRPAPQRRRQIFLRCCSCGARRWHRCAFLTSQPLSWPRAAQAAARGPNSPTCASWRIANSECLENAALQKLWLTTSYGAGQMQLRASRASPAPASS